MDIFDPASVAAAVSGITAHITAYSRKVERRTEQLRDQVAEMIRHRAELGFSGAIADDTFAVRDGRDVLADSAILSSVTVTVDPAGDSRLVIAHGEDAVWIEFGAGVYHNGSAGSYPNPLAAPAHMAAIGTYGLGHGAQEAWGYLGSDGKFHITRGTPAAMPLYRAVQSVAGDIVRIARGVFSA